MEPDANSGSSGKRSGGRRDSLSPDSATEDGKNLDFGLNEAKPAKFQAKLETFQAEFAKFQAAFAKFQAAFAKF